MTYVDEAEYTFPDLTETRWFIEQKRPTLTLEIRQVGWAYWNYFHPFHYLHDAGRMAYGTAFVGFVDDEPVTHLGVSGKTFGVGLREARFCRLVVHPEWQGAGLGLRFLNYMAERELQGNGYLKAPATSIFHTGHTALIAGLNRDHRWRPIAQRLVGGQEHVGYASDGSEVRWAGHFRPVASFRYGGQVYLDAP